MNYLLVLHELVPLTFKCLNLLLHAIDFLLEFLEILGVSTLHLRNDILIAGDGGGHFLFELMELPLVAGCLLLLGLNLAYLEIEVMLHEL